MKLFNLLKNVNIIYTNADLNKEILSICYDSRKASDKSLFVAIKGFETDGHQFIIKAKDFGCSVVVCEVKPDIDIEYILVENSREALAKLSCNFYDNPAQKMCIIGITGTSGKTTTTQLIKHVIEETYHSKVGLIGTNGNYIGDVEIHTEHTTPESLELQKLFYDMYNEGCKHVVMEVSSHALTLDRVTGFTFDVAAFTNLSQDHLDFHKDMDDYARAKKKIFSSCKHACINYDDNYSSFMIDGINCDYLLFSTKKPEADVYADCINAKSTGVDFTINYDDRKYLCNVGIPGEFTVYNALTVFTVCLKIGIKPDDIVKFLGTSTGVKGRMESVPTDGNYSIIIDYSHKPDALEKVLKTLMPVTIGKLFVLFGCGGDRDKLKRPIMGRIAIENSDFAIITSDNPRTENPKAIIDEIVSGIPGNCNSYIVIEDRCEAIRWAVDNASDGDVILLAGKGHEDYQVIGHNKIHLDEREIVSDIMKERKRKYDN